MDKCENDDILRLKNQLCFPLYACSKEVVRKYKPFLDELDLTYTHVKCLGQILYLDSGTLTPVLKKLESRGYLTRQRSKEDERNLRITITEEGNALKERARQIPQQVGRCVHLESDEAEELYRLLYKVLGDMV